MEKNVSAVKIEIKFKTSRLESRRSRIDAFFCETEGRKELEMSGVDRWHHW